MNRLCKSVVTKITSLRAYVRKMAAIMEVREIIVSGVQQEYFVTGKSRGPVVLVARPALRNGNAFQGAGKSTLMALDGREATIAEAVEILRVLELCADKLVQLVKRCVLRGMSSNSPTKKRMKVFLVAWNFNTVTNKERSATPAKRIFKNSGKPAKELHKVLCNLVEGYGRVTNEQVEKSVLEISAVLSQASTNVEGDDREPAVFPVVVLRGLTSTKLNRISLVYRRAKSLFSPSLC